MEDNVSKIKEKLDIVDVVSGYLKLAKAGVNFKARCPFHNEKTPSFFVTPERQIWHCFGCSKGGDMFGFIQDIEGVEFPEALRILAQKAGVTLEYSSGNFAAKDDKAVLYEICETASRFFEKQLNNSNAGRRALEYLKNRGLADETIKEFRLGFAPSEWESLSTFLRDCGYKDKDIVDAGLAIKRTTDDQQLTTNDRGIYDRFRSRIIFPISDLNGQVVGFTGRIFETNDQRPTTNDQSENSKSFVVSRKSSVESAKYINTPQTAIYDKSRVLYGLNKAKTEIRREDKCVMVEGNMDALMSYQAGVKNVVATSGTALTPGHLRIIQRYTLNLGFCFDTDQAGAMATRRGIGLALANGLNVKVVEISDKECKDPADYVRKYSAGPLISLGTSWSEIVSKAKPVLEFYFDKARADFDPNSAESKKTVVSILAPFIKRLISRVERAHWITQLAFLLRAKEDAVEADIELSKDDLQYDGQASPKVEVQTASAPSDILSETLLSVIMRNPALFREDMQNIDPGLLDGHTAQTIAKLVSVSPTDFGEFLKEFRGKDQNYKLEFAYLRSQELWKDFKDEELKTEFRNLMSKIKKRAISAQINNLVYDMKEAEVKKDKERVKELSLKFAELINQFPKNV